MNKRVLAVGNALIDSIVKLESDDILSELNLERGSMSLVDLPTFERLQAKIAHLPIVNSIAGSANNCIRMAAKLGAETSYIGKVGGDEMGRLYGENLSACGITAHLTTSEQLPTGQCISLVSADGERTMVTFLGAANTLAPADLPATMFEQYRGDSILFIEGYLVQSSELMRHIFATAREYGVEIAIDFASFNIVEESKELILELLDGGVKIIFANEAESNSFTSISEPAEALVALAKYCDIAIVKVGKEGSMLMEGELMVEVEATSHKPVDTTGAGDFYAGGFLYGYAAGESLDRSMQIASIAGGVATTIYGTTPTGEQWAEMITLVEQLKEE